MKKALLLPFLLAVFCVLGGLRASAQEKSNITVTSGELNNGVIILHVIKGEKGFELQCNQGAPACTVLKNGNYKMIELPKNFGMYECKDVEVYPESGARPDNTPPDKDKKLGEYCVVER